MRWILDRLKERSTYQGLIGLATAFGMAVNPEVANQVATAGIALASCISTCTKG